MTVENEDFLGYSVVACRRQDCIADIVAAVRTGQRNRSLACINPHSYATAAKDDEFAAALRAADWLIPDGVGVVLASRLLNGNIAERITGSDIFWGVHEALNRLGGFSAFFVGSTDETLDAIRRKMA